MNRKQVCVLTALKSLAACPYSVLTNFRKDSMESSLIDADSGFSAIIRSVILRSVGDHGTQNSSRSHLSPSVSLLVFEPAAPD